MAGLFPGAQNLSQFWENLVNGIESVKHFSVGELLETGLLDPQLINNPDFIPVKGYLDDATLFAAKFFGISDKKASILDPQFRLFLECVWQALEDAGYSPKEIKSTVGVYATSSTEGSYYYQNLLSNKELLKEADPYELLISNAKDFMATFVAYCLNFKGPCLNIQTACSSSLVAICKACDDLLSGKCDVALAGGVSVTFPLKNGYLYKSGMIYSKDGHCKAFSVDASGTVSGNGGGVVVLKRLSQAKIDNDHIYAVIKGYAINNDGRNKLSYTAPSIDGQLAALSAAAKMANVDPAEISYIEAHGTGTRLGDQIEITAIKRFLSSGEMNRSGPCMIGSVKSNIGHLDVASGIASFIKAALSLKNGTIPPTLFCESPNSELAMENLISIASQNSSWAQLGNSSKKYIGISSFGVGGTNAHVILMNSVVDNPKKSLNPTALKDRQSYYISPPLLYAVSSKAVNRKVEDKLPGAEMLYVPTWVESHALPIAVLNPEAFVIIQDHSGRANDVFNSLVNEYSDARVNMISAIKLSPDGINDNWLKQRIDAWINVFKKYEDVSTIHIIHFSFGSSSPVDESSILSTHFYEFIAMAKALSQLEITKSIKLFSIGNGFAKVDGSEVLIPAVNTLFGPLNSLPVEYPFIEMRAIDIGTQFTRAELLSRLQKEFILPDNERLVAYRQGGRYVLAAQKAIERQSDLKPISLRKTGAYVITGGLGGIGLVFAEYLAVNYQAKLVLITKDKFPAQDQWDSLLSESSLSPKIREQLLKLCQIKKQAAGLLIYSADVANRDEMKAILSDSVKIFGAINGAIHAASAYPEGLIKTKDITDINLMFRSKIVGLTVLHELLTQYSIDFLLLCSSLNTYIYASGAVDYMAANAYMDAYAQFAASQSSYPILSINWDAWKEVGMRHKSPYKQHMGVAKASLVDLNEFRWKSLVEEHVVNGKLVVPGAMLVEILIASILTNKIAKLPIYLNNLAFMRMAGYKTLNNAALSVLFHGDEIKVQQPINGKDYPIFQAEMDREVNEYQYDKSVASKLMLQFKQSEVISLKSVGYNHAAIQLGEHWHCLKSVRKANEYYLAELELPKQFLSEAEDYIMHPALLDVAYSFHANFLNDEFVPYYIKHLRVYAKLPRSFYSIVHLKKYDPLVGIYICDVTLLDADENVLVMIEEFYLKPISQKLRAET
jgi:3-oxoacyl-(acyl-carrier-protein) synthase/NAD(P)-dependent dehydrogenase (short-subunit alcohol dehydrogenase family)